MRRLEPELADSDDVLRDAVVLLGVGRAEDPEKRSNHDISESFMCMFSAASDILVLPGVRICHGQDGNAGLSLACWTPLRLRLTSAPTLCSVQTRCSDLFWKLFDVARPFP